MLNCSDRLKRVNVGDHRSHFIGRNPNDGLAVHFAHTLGGSLLLTDRNTKAGTHVENVSIISLADALEHADGHSIAAT